MTKNDILKYFKDINYAYNNSNQLDTLSDMIDELLKEQEQALKREYMRGYDKAWDEIGSR